MRAKQFITELFNATSNVKWAHANDNYTKGKYRATVVNGDLNLDITFSQYSGEEENGSAEYEVSFRRNGSEKMTGDGDAQRVLATVLTAIRDFMKYVDPHTIIFYAEYGETGSRPKLYKRMLDRYINTSKYEVYVKDLPDQQQVKFIIQVPLPLYGSNTGYYRKGHFGPVR